ncbi:MAG: four helix bundle protein [Candidatus Omnitrophica bacterium]|jgi:four helix bundle protein|nr:four helix bundle protein [Candidatus Omnitrophota bacterium]
MDSKTRTYQFALKIIVLVDHLSMDLSTKVAANQLLRAATSIGANIVEAQACSSRKDFTNYFNHALKSANESKYWLELLRDSKKSNAENIEPLIKESEEIAKILAASIITLKNQRQF